MRWLHLLFLIVLPGCLYLEIINEAPVVRIQRVGSGEVHKGEAITFAAEGTADPDGDLITYHWEATSCAGCSAIATSETDGLELFAPAQGTMTVRLTVVDAHGAIAEASIQLTVVDRPPMAMLQVTTPPKENGTYTVTTEIVFAASGTDPDGDALSYTFVVHPPPQSDPAKAHADQTSATLFQLTPDVAGSWEVVVTVTDTFGMTSTASQTVTVSADAPPCIETTDPVWSPEGRVIVLRAEEARRFHVDSVSDDLDAFPGSGIHFRWLVAGPGAGPLQEVLGHDLADLVLAPSELDPGDVLTVRVEVADRISRVLPCAMDQASCSIGGNTCVQRLTWTVEIR